MAFIRRNLKFFEPSIHLNGKLITALNQLHIKYFCFWPEMLRIPTNFKLSEFSELEGQLYKNVKNQL